MTREQAVERVKELLDEAIVQLPASAEPELEYTQDSSPCDDPTDGGPAGRIFVTYEYWIRNLDRDDYPEQFATLRQFWEEQGYRKYRDDPGRLGKLVYEDHDGFEVMVQLTGDGEILVLIAASPCVWPDGTPDPEAG